VAEIHPGRDFPQSLEYFAATAASSSTPLTWRANAGPRLTPCSAFSHIPTTYAGGVKNLADLYRVKELGLNRLDATIGSALDIFGGTGITYAEAVAFNRQEGC
jgi:hypothetical protein